VKSSKDRYRFRLLFFSISLICLIVSPTIILAKTYHLTILHTNDHHGHFAKFNPYPVSAVGGLAAQSTLVNIVRAEVESAGGYTLLLSGGDVNTGVPESDMLDAEPDFKLMNVLGYDAMVLGNHEFDNPRDVLMKQKGWAQFPFLSANVVKKDKGEALVDPYVIRDFDGLKVAIFGLTTEESPILVMPKHVQDLEFKSVIETATGLVPKLRAEADLVIALTHLGFYEESGGRYNAAGALKLAREVSGIDLIVGGHSHTAVREPKVIKNTLIVQAGEWSKYVGRLDLTIDSDADKVTHYEYELIPVNMKRRIKYRNREYYMYIDKGYLEDERVLEAMKPYLAKADQVLSQPVGKALVKLDGDRKLVRSRETNLANLVTDSMRAKCGAQIAFQNAGGIRAGIAPGTITYRDILEVQPFGNTLVIMNMTGTQIMEVLHYAATVRPGHGAFLQVSGLKWTNKKGKAENVMVGDSPLIPEKKYKVVTNSFMAAGGDGYAMLKEIRQVDTGFVDADALREYIEKLTHVEPRVEGRLTLIK
jgi:5'-nucleotidase/UDP-sugar diphosphatase